MEIKITMETVMQNGMVAGVGTCSPEEKWLEPHVKAIAEAYAKRVYEGKSAPAVQPCQCPCDCEDEDEDEDEDLPVCPYCGEEVDADDRLIMMVCGERKEYCPHCGELIDPDDWEYENG